MDGFLPGPALNWEELTKPPRQGMDKSNPPEIVVIWYGDYNDYYIVMVMNDDSWWLAVN